MSSDSGTRNLFVLTAGMAAAFSGGPLVVLTGSLIGSDLAPSPSLATLPIGTFVVGMAAASFPAAMIMRRLGRRRGFALGTAIAALACGVALEAISSGSLALFCIATLLIGGNLAIVQQYRFAAVESVPERHAARAVSIVLTAGIISGILGPELARQTRDWLPTPFAGSFIVLGALYVAVTLLMLLALRDPPTVITRLVASGSADPRPILARPSFRLALAAGMAAYGVMILIMTATPVSMHLMDGYTVEATAAVIQGHAVAMYAPSLLSGLLVSRFGTTRLMSAGVLAMSLCAVLGLASGAWLAYWAGLVSLGIGWNLLFLGATVHLTRSYEPNERFRAQGLNDGLVFGVEAIAALAAGPILHAAGWRGVNTLALVSLAGLVLVLLSASSRLNLIPCNPLKNNLLRP